MAAATQGQLEGEDSDEGSEDQDLGGATGTGSVIMGGTKKGPNGRADVWHRHNAIFVLNPNKVRRQAVLFGCKELSTSKAVIELPPAKLVRAATCMLKLQR